MTSASGSAQSQDPELPQFWKDIKKETGFSTYVEYLDAYRDATRGRHNNLAVFLQLRAMNTAEDFGAKDLHAYCSIWDMFGTGTFSSCFAGPLSWSDGSGIDILTSLRNPDSDAILRVILLEPAARINDFPPFLLDIFGLGLRIVPDFFEAYLARSGINQDYSRILGEGSAFLGNSLITVARKYLPGMSTCPPVLLIMADQFKIFEELQPVVFIPQLAGDPRWERYCKSFENIVRDSLKHSQSQTVTLDVALLHSLLPLVKYDLKQLEKTHARAMTRYLPLLDDKNPEDAMEAIRSTLRRQVCRFEDCMSNFKKCFRDQHIVHLERYEAFSLLIAESHDSLNAARALESEIRDWLQLRVGRLALEESKKSIKNSNLQIEQSKRVNLVTFLAFVYVPLNLATSIFGMNLQQINKSGQHVWTFVLTAVVALVLTSVVWITIGLYRDYRQWRDQMKAPPEIEWVKRERQYSFVIRTAVLSLLLKKGYRRWLWVSGAWIRILTNERIKLRVQAKTSKDPWVNKYLAKFRDQTACDYVCQHIRGEYTSGYFEIDEEQA